ncbi:protein commissureless 2 homolog [Cylas formicarius]|uniref:protein commissureless 2 homolog n=1 Tax=Cylas formicarius TaxID=197179 RepID=UPI00295865A7|nr:protein commissureless 2 homolog [Cylas formicarius]
MEDGIWDVTLPPIAVNELEFNITDFAVLQVNENQEVSAVADPAYEQFLADVWVGIVLTLMVLSCVCFMCTCLIYHKFQEWKSRVTPTTRPTSTNVEAGSAESELPSYTIASGLPTYEEALEQLKKVKELQQDKGGGVKPNAAEINENRRPHENGDTATTTATLSVFNLFQIYNKGTNGRRFSKST